MAGAKQATGIISKSQLKKRRLEEEAAKKGKSVGQLKRTRRGQYRSMPSGTAPYNNTQAEYARQRLANQLGLAGGNVRQPFPTAASSVTILPPVRLTGPRTMYTGRQSGSGLAGGLLRMGAPYSPQSGMMMMTTMTQPASHGGLMGGGFGPQQLAAAIALRNAAGMMMAPPSGLPILDGYQGGTGYGASQQNCGVSGLSMPSGVFPAGGSYPCGAAPALSGNAGLSSFQVAMDQQIANSAAGLLGPFSAASVPNAAVRPGSGVFPKPNSFNTQSETVGLQNQMLVRDFAKPGPFPRFPAASVLSKEKAKKASTVLDNIPEPAKLGSVSTEEKRALVNKIIELGTAALLAQGGVAGTERSAMPAINEGADRDVATNKSSVVATLLEKLSAKCKTSTTNNSANSWTDIPNTNTEPRMEFGGQADRLGRKRSSPSRIGHGSGGQMLLGSLAGSTISGSSVVNDEMPAQKTMSPWSRPREVPMTLEADDDGYLCRLSAESANSRRTGTGFSDLVVEKGNGFAVAASDRSAVLGGIPIRSTASVFPTFYASGPDHFGETASSSPLQKHVHGGTGSAFPDVEHRIDRRNSTSYNNSDPYHDHVGEHLEGESLIDGENSARAYDIAAYAAGRTQTGGRPNAYNADDGDRRPGTRGMVPVGDRRTGPFPKFPRKH